MFFSIRELEVKKVHFDTTFAPGEIDFLEESLRQKSPLHVEGVAELLPNTDGEVRVRGNLQVTMEVDCDRCLEPTPVPLDTKFDLFYRPVEKRAAGEEIEIDAGESEMGFYEGAGLQLEDILREHVLLTMPMQQVCREDCQGICPVCGQNRNQAACGCEQKLADDRWAALRNLKTGTP